MTLMSDQHASENFEIDGVAAGEVALPELFKAVPVEHVGPLIETKSHEELTLTLYYEAFVPGYPGWRWAVTVAQTGEDSNITVLETNLQPTEASLMAPDWVPWAERLANFRKAQARQAQEEAAAALAAAEELRDEDDVDPDDDLLENDFSDFDDELDGVDIDLFDEEE